MSLCDTVEILGPSVLPGICVVVDAILFDSFSFTFIFYRMPSTIRQGEEVGCSTGML